MYMQVETASGKKWGGQAVRVFFKDAFKKDSLNCALELFLLFEDDAELICCDYFQGHIRRYQKSEIKKIVRVW